MQYEFSVTLKKIQITNPDLKGNKVIASLSQGNVTKRIINPRFIRNRLGNFFLERLIITSEGLKKQNSKATLQIWMLNPSGQEEIGRVEFDVEEMARESEKPGAKAQYVRNQLDNIILEYDVLLQRNQIYLAVDHDAEMQNIEAQAIQKFKLRQIQRPYLSPAVRTRRVNIGDVRSNASPSNLRDDDSSDGDNRTQRSQRIKIVRSGSNPNRMNALLTKKLSIEDNQSKNDMTPNKNQLLNTNTSTEKKDLRKNEPATDKKEKLVPELKIGSLGSLQKNKTTEANPQYLFDMNKFKSQNIKELIRREREAELQGEASSSSINKRKDLQIEVIQYDPLGNGPTMARKVESTQEVPVVPNILISNCSPKMSLSSRPPLPVQLSKVPKKSSFRKNSINESNISSSGKKHVRYSKKVDISEIEAKIKRLQQRLTKKDIIYNVLYGIGAMAAGVVIGML